MSGMKYGQWFGQVAEEYDRWRPSYPSAANDQHDRSNKGTFDGITRYLPGVRADELEFQSFPWTWGLSPEHRARYLATTSMSITVTDDERERTFSENRAALQRGCDAEEHAMMPIRYEASCVRWTPSTE